MGGGAAHRGAGAVAWLRSGVLIDPSAISDRNRGREAVVVGFAAVGIERKEAMTAVDAQVLRTPEQVLRGISARAGEIDRLRAFPRDSLAELAGAGLFGLLAPAGDGGSGGGLEVLARECEALGRACASTAMTFLMHSVTVATIATGGGDRAEELLAGLARGDRLGTLAFSERGSGAHFYAPGLSAKRNVSGRLRISGRKAFVTSSGHADVYLVLVASDAGGTDCYAVDGDAAGLAADGEWTGIGMAGNASAGLVFDDVEVDEAARIGDPGESAGLVFGTVAPVFLVGLAAVNVGIADAAASAATAHVVGRTYEGGGRLVDVEVLQQALAGMDQQVVQARLLVREAARLGEAGAEEALVRIMEAKVAATEASREVALRAMETCGGQGYTTSLPVERHLRDALAGAVMAPTNGVLRTWIGKAVAGLPVP